MISFRAKTWTGMGAALLLGGLAACGGEGDGGEAAQAPAQGSPPAAGGEGEGGEGEGGEGAPAGVAGTGGEQGAQAAYAAVPAESRPALRLAHLKGFFLAAEQVARAAAGPEAAGDAAALAGQGMLEAYDPAAAELKASGLDAAALRKAAETGDPGALRAAIARLDHARGRAGGEPVAVARGLSAITVGIYREAAAGSTLDPVEYQHAYAAALALQDHVRGHEALSSVRADADRLVALWRSTTPTVDAPSLAQVQAQASRVELALSGA